MQERSRSNYHTFQPAIVDGQHAHLIGLYSRKTWSVVVVTAFLAFIAMVGLFSVNYDSTDREPANLRSTDFETSTTDDSVSYPNIIYILADDLGWNALDSVSDLNFTTTFLSELAGKGIYMDNYYGQEVCTPSRASLMTGRYPVTIGMQFGDVDPTEPWGLPLEEITLPEIMRDYGGYSTYGLGKWNLGHFTPLMLPTARGFDYFLGYVNGQNYYWSKRFPNKDEFIDFLYMDTTCYSGYNGTDMHTYSTMFYRDKAVRIIENHDYSSKPLFLYIAFQAVHDPFFDDKHFHDGIPKSYFSDEMYDMIHTTIVGRNRRQYAMALALLDDAVSDIYEAVESSGQLDNTYIIFASDNGGCVVSGGKNGPLRGSKGTLFEGGTKVNAFIYSPLLSLDLQGSTYSGLMHVSDWLPTILNLTGVSYSPDSTHEFDGYSQVEAFSSGITPREYMLYNYYIDVNEKNFNMYTNGPVAIRNTQYKLIHAFENYYSEWFEADDIVEDDDVLKSSSCSQSDNISGNFTYFLFDLINDPNETNNLFDNSDYTTIQTELYTELATIKTKIADDYASSTKSKAAYVAWRDLGGYIGPWISSQELEDTTKNYPEICSFDSMISPTWPNDDDDGYVPNSATE